MEHNEFFAIRLRVPRWNAKAKVEQQLAMTIEKGYKDLTSMKEWRIIWSFVEFQNGTGEVNGENRNRTISELEIDSIDWNACPRCQLLAGRQRMPFIVQRSVQRPSLPDS